MSRQRRRNEQLKGERMEERRVAKLKDRDAPERPSKEANRVKKAKPVERPVEKRAAP
jgi:hypothetical protein